VGGFTTSNQVQYRPTGILLEVKPTVSASGMVSMTISQEVSARAGSVLVGGSEYPNFSKRKVTTDITVEEGKTIVLAGLIESRGDGNVTGVPGLKDIPLLGALFGTTRKVSNKTELLMTITPYIVRNREESDRLTSSFQGAMSELRERLARSGGVHNLKNPPATPNAVRGEGAGPQTEPR
jgi:general secretion pathway protein D